MTKAPLKSVTRSKSLIQIHMAVFLFGSAGLFGKFLSCSPFYIVLGRTFFGALALFIYARFISGVRLSGFKAAHILFFLSQGVLLACHWVLFFLSIQVSSVAVGLVTFSSFPLFVTFMEPVFFKERLKPADVVTAVAVFIGIVLVVPEISLSNKTTLGAFYGILSGLTFAMLALVNRKNARQTHAVTVAFYQNFFAALLLVFPVLFLKPAPPALSDLPMLIALGVVFTALAHSCFINALSEIRAQTASVIAGLEPVYGIVLAFFILNETPDLRTVSGGIIIIGTTIAAGYLARGQGQGT
ncbi:MAG: DMT family transporter [Desulfobacterales bacterium]|nr:DMT family transporter [Desulfobacterales bacterium]